MVDDMARDGAEPHAAPPTPIVRPDHDQVDVLLVGQGADGLTGLAVVDLGRGRLEGLGRLIGHGLTPLGPRICSLKRSREAMIGPSASPTLPRGSPGHRCTA